MRFLHLRSIVLPACILLLHLFGIWGRLAHGQTVVNFQTEDGWTIYGILHLPEEGTRDPVPGVVLLGEPGWILQTTYNSRARMLVESGMAALSIDMRGTGSSVGGRNFSTLSPKELENLQLDIRGAVKFLSSQKIVDAQRIGIVGVGIGANYAVLETSENPGIRALVLISGSFGQTALDYVKFRKDLPILGLVGKDDKESFRQMAEVFYLSESKASDLILDVGMGHGTAILNHLVGLEEKIVQWLGDNLKGLGTEITLSLKSDDGWTLPGRLRMPDGVDENSKVPGVVFVHGAQHDQETYYHLSQAVVKKGMAALTFNWRGHDGTYRGDSSTEIDRNSLYLDVKAAIQFLASQKGVDASRIGLIAATFSTNHALQAAMGDPGVKTLVILTQYVPTEEAKRYLTVGDTPIFFIASSKDINYNVGNLSEFTREAYRLSTNKYSEFLLYDDAGRGSEMLKKKTELSGMIVRWLGDKLAQ